jgi:signal transduction histidine kinase
MNSLIDDILKLSRISREQMEFTEVDITELAREVMDEMRRSDPNRAVDIRIETNMTASCDRSLLRIALDNLFSNAWKFTTRNPVARIEMGRGGEDSFFVRDNGAGFKMEDVHKLFQPFQRLHPASEYPGTGIGLAIVNRIIRRHGGRIWAEGAQGTGAVFTFTLPRS